MEDESSMESIYVSSPEGGSVTPLPYPKAELMSVLIFSKKSHEEFSLLHMRILLFSHRLFCWCYFLRVHGLNNVIFLKSQLQEASDYMRNSAVKLK